MAFWSVTNITDPKRQHRWLIEIGSGAFKNTATYVCKKVNKPKVTVTNAEHKFLNHTFNYPGSVTFEPVSVTFVDAGDPHTTEILYEILKAGGYRLPSLINDAVGAGPQCETPGKDASVGALTNCNILTLDGEGTVLEKTKLINAWISSIDFGGELSYEADGMMEITAEIRYDWVELDFGTGGRSIGGDLADKGSMIVEDLTGGVIGF